MESNEEVRRQLVIAVRDRVVRLGRQRLPEGSREPFDVAFAIAERR